MSMPSLSIQFKGTDGGGGGSLIIFVYLYSPFTDILHRTMGFVYFPETIFHAGQPIINERFIHMIYVFQARSMHLGIDTAKSVYRKFKQQQIRGVLILTWFWKSFNFHFSMR